MHEIVTLQLGQSSNYLATHFWNVQESYFTYDDEAGPLDHDIHFRPGIGADGSDTFTPRTLIYDLKGGFGSLKKINALYEVGEGGNIHGGLWDSQPVIQRDMPIEQHPYQRSLDQGLEPPELTTETVRYWSDFNRVFYHPRSIIQLNEFELNSTLMPFEKWSTGEELFSCLDKEHDLLDRDLRLFIEESDQLQALQIITGVDDAWGGFATRYLERLEDEFGKTSIWVWGLENSRQNGKVSDSSTVYLTAYKQDSNLGVASRSSYLLILRSNAFAQEKRQLKTLSLARSLQGMASQASLYIPLTIPPRPLPSYVSFDRGSEWHRSALLSTALETMTLPSRLKAPCGEQVTLTQFEESLNAKGNQKIAYLQLSVLKPELRDSQNPDYPTVTVSDPTQTRAPNEEDALVTLDMNLSPSEIGQSQKGHSPKVHMFGQVEVVRGAPSDRAFVGGNRQLLQRPTGHPVVRRYCTTLGHSLDSAPRLFYSQESQSIHTPRSLVVHTSLSTTSSAATRIKSVQSAVRGLVGLDERETLLNELSEIREAYEEGWDSGSDEDDD